MIVETWLHFSLTSVGWFWTIKHFESSKYSLASNKLQSTTLHAIFTLVIYPLIFVASIECPGYTILTGKNTHCITFYLWNSSQSGLYLYMEAASCRSWSPFFLITMNDGVTPRFSRCMLIFSRFQPIKQLFYLLDNCESARWNLAWWMVYGICFHGNGFEFVPIQVLKVIRSSVCVSVKSIFDCGIGWHNTRF